MGVKVANKKSKTPLCGTIMIVYRNSTVLCDTKKTVGDVHKSIEVGVSDEKIGIDQEDSRQ
jgi:hypothetical protein